MGLLGMDGLTQLGFFLGPVVQSDTREVDSADVVAVFSSPNDAVGWVLTCR
jgi:hypothetical protein